MDLDQVLCLSSHLKGWVMGIAMIFLLKGFWSFINWLRNIAQGLQTPVIQAWEINKHRICAPIRHPRPGAPMRCGCGLNQRICWHDQPGRPNPARRAAALWGAHIAGFYHHQGPGQGACRLDWACRTDGMPLYAKLQINTHFQREIWVCCKNLQLLPISKYRKL